MTPGKSLKKRKRVTSQPNSAESETVVLIALPETEALLALSRGAITLSGISVGSRSSQIPGTLRCWKDTIPLGAVRALVDAAGFGGVVALKLRLDSSSLV